VLVFEDGMEGRRADVTVGLFEFEEMAFVLHALRNDELFVDVGANIGIYTVLGAGGVGASCLSLEPVPDTFGQLRANLRQNNLAEQVDALNVGAGAESETLQFTVSKGANNHVREGGRDEGTVPVPAKPIDALLPRSSHSPSILKIDVEGWEGAVLRGAERTLLQNAPLALIVELCEGDHYGFDEEKIDDNLREMGFTPVVYKPFRRILRSVDRRRTGGNTLYVNDLDGFAERVRSSRSYSILGQKL
jgi:FkbM family methyltransferase